MSEGDSSDSGDFGPGSEPVIVKLDLSTSLAWDSDHWRRVHGAAFGALARALDSLVVVTDHEGNELKRFEP